MPIDITQYVKPVKNSIILSRNFEPAGPKILYDEKTFGTELALTNSLRNLLGALHYTPVFPGAWSFKFSGRGRDGRNWLEKRKDGTAKSWSDNYFFRPFGVKGVMITCERYS